MNRTERLDFCNKCTKRAFSKQKGIVCSLTDQHANFENLCPDFSVDEKVEREEEIKRLNRAEVENRIRVGGGVKKGNSKGVVIGILAIIGSIIWFFGAIIAADRIFFYPIFLFGWGIYSIINGASGAGAKRKQENSDILDF